jgi:hypothetical protein
MHAGSIYKAVCCAMRCVHNGVPIFDSSVDFQKRSTCFNSQELFVRKGNSYGRREGWGPAVHNHTAARFRVVYVPWAFRQQPLYNIDSGDRVGYVCGAFADICNRYVKLKSFASGKGFLWSPNKTSWADPCAIGNNESTSIFFEGLRQRRLIVGNHIGQRTLDVFGRSNDLVCLFTTINVLKNANSDLAQSEECNRAGEQNHQLFALTDSILKIGYTILLGVVGYLLCVLAGWLIWRRWDIRGTGLGLALYVLAFVLICHAISLWHS